MSKKALLFDLNGTMINDMQYHIKAWHRILNELGADLSLERGKDECYGKNDELLERIFPGRFSEEEKKKMSLAKEKQYQEQFRPHLRLLPGLDQFLKQAYTGKMYMAIGSAAIPYNIDFVIDYFQIRHYFGAIVSADDVRISKPDPETFLTCARILNVDPADCIVFEDAPKGVEAAARAGMKAVVITTLHTAEEFAGMNNVLFYTRDYNHPQVLELLD